MITKEEIELKAKEFEIHQSNVERDYVFGWILHAIFTRSILKETIFLKGGNALRKGYFANTRFSYDLDFGIPNDIDQNILLEIMNSVCDFINEKTGVSFVKENNRVEEKFTATESPLPGLHVYEVRIYFKDFYGKSDHIKIKVSMDITRFDKVLLPIQTVDLIHPYSDVEDIACKIRCIKLEEVIATKMKCLLQRQHAPDLFDYVNSIKILGGDLDKEEVSRTFIQKTIFEKNPHVVRDILRKTSFDFFKEYWSKTIVCAKQFMFGVDEAISIFISDLENIFCFYPDNKYANFTYFEADLRGPIMKAGRNQTLLKIRYNGSERIVEPYSLKYLQKKGGESREYFYVFNRSGGSNPPGIRSLLPKGMELIENTDEKFIPQFPIELCKAGELPEKKYLFDPNRPTPARPQKRTSRNRIRYIYQCKYCGRKFTKTKMNGSLNEHKDKFGNRCGGRYGTYVDTRF
jgi:predicted nucleotidyltransferase component of viral defense system